MLCLSHLKNIYIYIYIYYFFFRDFPFGVFVVFVQISGFWGCFLGVLTWTPWVSLGPAKLLNCNGMNLDHRWILISDESRSPMFLCFLYNQLLSPAWWHILKPSAFILFLFIFLNIPPFLMLIHLFLPFYCLFIYFSLFNAYLFLPF